jgi:hypothetical protein
MDPQERAYGTFTTRELERLAVYRAAVKAGFYSDWDGSASSPDIGVLGEVLGHADESGAQRPLGYSFNPDEQQRLERCREALVAGRYVDDLPPRPAEAEPVPDESVTPDESTR